MATITEDYVSFEIAELLKEKGFDWECYGYYDTTKHPDYMLEHSGSEIDSNDGPDCYISAPTLQMAMAWLREVHHLYIDVGFGNDYKGEFLYMADIYDLTKGAIHAKYEPIIEADDYLSVNPKTYEEAVEAAIKYCLENLI